MVTAKAMSLWQLLKGKLLCGKIPTGKNIF